MSPQAHRGQDGGFEITLTSIEGAINQPHMFLPSLVLTSILRALVPSPELISLFDDHYLNHYQVNQSWQNSKRFADEALAAGLASTFVLVQLENHGTTSLGLVNALQARQVTSGGERFSGERNFYLHAFLVDESGQVYDSDFTAEPTVKRIHDYVQQMYLGAQDEGAFASPGNVQVGSEKKLSDYHARVYLPVLEDGYRSWVEGQTIVLRNFLATYER